jgi:hypothetical protein
MSNKISKYEEYLLEKDIQMLLEATIVFDDKFNNLLKRINTPVSRNLRMLNGIEVDTNYNYITFDVEKEDKVFFIPDDKAKKVDDPYTLKKSDMNVGRFVRAILTKAGREVDNKELEDFVNKYKAAILVEKEAFTRFEIVKGEDIKHWYNFNQYEREMGTLGSSCMRYSKCRDFLEIYSSNPERCSLIILKSKTDDTKITGRALLWLDNKDRQFMDRIYIQDSADTQLFIDYAIDNGFYYKKNQTYMNGDPIMFNGQELTREDSWIYITLEHGGDFNKYPYMDTIKFYTPYQDLLTNNWTDSYEYELTDTEGGDGSCSSCGGSGEVECEDCGGSGEVDCWRCQGDGERECSECEGDGVEDCPQCDRAGTVDCAFCDGTDKVECPQCEGSGEFEGSSCDNCDGEGKIPCSNCDDGQVECPKCEGEGTRDCRECGGRGLEECNYCDGDGTSECRECGGDGRISCYDCS